MKTKKFLLALIISIGAIASYSQRNPDNEILVFFSEGTSLKTETIENITVKKVNFTKEELKQSLNTAGIPDSLIELALPNFKREDTLKILQDGRKLKQPDMTKLIRIKVPKGKNRKDLIEHLNSLTEVLYAEPNGRVNSGTEPNDTRYQNNEQWGLNNTVYVQSDIHAEEAWNIYTGNSNNIIAIMDGGVQITHVDLNDKISGGDTDYGWNGHGTHIAGIAAAESNNGQGISGVDWNARIHPQRIDLGGHEDVYQAIIDAINYSINVKVLNHSWIIGNEDVPNLNSTTIRQAFAYAYKANRTSVTIMGNFHDTHPGVVTYPGGFSNVIAVGATTNSPYEIIRPSSGRGNHIDLCAPGENILSTMSSNYFYASGTSTAAPFVSGVASLLKGYNSNLANDDIEHILKLSSNKVAGMNGQDFDATYGYGRLNAERALKFLQAPYTLRQWTATSGSVNNSVGFYNMQILGASGLASANYSVKRYEVRKTVTFPESFLRIDGAWGRGVFSNGWRYENPNYGEGFCEVVPGTLTGTGVTLRTYVYEVKTISGSTLGYYPATPANATFAYTVLGIPSPTLSGSDVICYSGTTYTIVDPPENTTITWGGTNVAYPNGNTGTSVTVRAASSSTAASGTVTVSFTFDGTQRSVSKTVWVGKPVINYISGPQNLPYGGNQTYTANVSGANGATYQWSVSPSLPLTSYGDNVQISFPSTNGDYVITLVVTGCGPSAPYYYYVSTGEYEINIIYPNPASDETTLTLASALPANELDDLQEWENEIYTQNQSLKEKKTKLKGYTTKINTSGWKEGVYIVRVKYGKEVFQGKLIVKR